MKNYKRQEEQPHLNSSRNTGRCFFIAKFEEAVWVLHSFVKKTQKTSQTNTEIGLQRLKQVQEARTDGKSETVKDDAALEGIGDVWQFLGFEENEGSERDLTAQLLLQVQRLIKGKKHLSVAKPLGTSQPRVSDLKRGNIDKFSAAALHGFLQKLDPEAR